MGKDNPMNQRRVVEIFTYYDIGICASVFEKSSLHCFSLLHSSACVLTRTVVGIRPLTPPHRWQLSRLWPRFGPFVDSSTPVLVGGCKQSLWSCSELLMTTTMIINTDPLQFGMLDKDPKIGEFWIFYCSAFFVASYYVGRTDQGVNSL